VIGRARAVLAIAVLLAGGTAVPGSEALAQDVIVRGSAGHRTIALTFDDGSDPGRCLQIGRILDKAGVPATWFPNGFRVRSAPNVWRSLARRFPMANHTMNHPSLVGRSRAEIRAEVLRNERLIERITGRRMLHLLRPPFGAYDRRVVREARRLGYRVVLWSLSAADTSPRSTDRAIAVRALSGGPGSIILMHCGPEVTPRILPVVIARYACAGYRFAELDGLLAGRRGVRAKVTCPAGALPPAPKRRAPKQRAPKRQTSRPDREARPEVTRAPGPAESRVVSYDLGAATVAQPGLRGTRFAEMPVELRGIVAAPVGDGPFPVALVVHGSYASCDAPLVDDVDPWPCPTEHDLRQFEGFGELAEALAERGYLAVVPDLSAEYTNGFGWAPFGERTVAIVDAHLAALADGTGFPTGLANKADLDRLVLVGHSRGGALAVRYATDEAAGRDPRALALLTPAWMAPEAAIPEMMPTALVMASCDGDVGLESPLRFLQEQLPSQRPAPTLVYTLPGGTHNAFSTKLAADKAPECADEDRMDPARQRATMGTLLPDFFDLALGIPRD